MFARHRAAKGAAFVELALVLPLLMTVLVATADFARVFYYSIELTNAARAGAQYATYNPARANVANAPNVRLAAQSAAPNIAPLDTPIDVSTVCQCATQDGGSQPWAVIVCGSPCGAGTHQFETVTVTTRKTFTMISRFVPGIPSTLQITRKATLRVPL